MGFLLGEVSKGESRLSCFEFYSGSVFSVGSGLSEEEVSGEGSAVSVDPV